MPADLTAVWRGEGGGVKLVGVLTEGGGVLEEILIGVGGEDNDRADLEAFIVLLAELIISGLMEYLGGGDTLANGDDDKLLSRLSAGGEFPLLLLI